MLNLKSNLETIRNSSPIFITSTNNEYHGLWFGHAGRHRYGVKKRASMEVNVIDKAIQILSHQNNSLKPVRTVYHSLATMSTGRRPTMKTAPNIIMDSAERASSQSLINQRAGNPETIALGQRAGTLETAATAANCCDTHRAVESTMA